MTYAEYEALKRAEKVRAAIEIIEADIGSRFYGLENVTQKGPRRWSLAPRAPNAAIEKIQGKGKDLPRHMVRKWCNIRRQWRTVDLRTTTRITYTDSSGTVRDLIYA